MSIERRQVWFCGTALLTGLVAGAGTALLLAPQSGARTRRQLHGMAADIGERATEVMEDATTSIRKVWA